jgi:hypothetical protein
MKLSRVVGVDVHVESDLRIALTIRRGAIGDKPPQENLRLRRAISDLTLDKLILQEAARGNF